MYSIWIAELMLLGFISLLLTVFQGLISQMCIPENVTHAFLPCNRPRTSSEPGTTKHFMGLQSFIFGRGRRRLLAVEGSDQCSRHVRWSSEINSDIYIYMIITLYLCIFREKFHYYHSKLYTSCTSLYLC